MDQSAPTPLHDGHDVYHWPEFKALCARLGVDWDQATTAITIRIAEGEIPKVTHEYAPRDHQLKVDLDEPVVLPFLPPPVEVDPFVVVVDRKDVEIKDNWAYWRKIHPK